MSTISHPSLKAQAFTDRWQVEIVDLTATYMRNAGMKSAAIVDGVEFCRVEEFAARHFRRAGFEAVFLESGPFQVLFGVYFWSVIQDRCDRRVRMVGILDRRAYDQRRPSEVSCRELLPKPARIEEKPIKSSGLLTPSGQGHHEASVSDRRMDRRAA